MGKSCSVAASPTGSGGHDLKSIEVYAGLGIRFLALAIDLAVFCMAFFPITRLVKGVWIMGQGDHQWAQGRFVSDPLCVAFFVVMLVYYVSLEGLAGATLGKWAVGIRVIRVDGRRPGLARGLVRNLFRLADGLPAFSILGIVLILTSAERARFGDRVAGTRVIRVRRGWSICCRA